MNKFYFLITALVALTTQVNAQLIEEWDVQTGLFPNGADGEIKFDSNGDVVIVRNESYSGSVNYDHAIQKYNPEGTLLWEIVNDNVFDEVNFNVFDWTFDMDDNIILCGDQETTTALYEKTYLMKVSAAGDVLWQQQITSIPDWSEEIYSVVTDEDGSIYVSAQLYHDEVETLQEALVKINPVGDILWTRFYDEYTIGDLEMHNNRLFAVSELSVREYNMDGDELWNTPIAYESEESSANAVGMLNQITFEANSFRIVSRVYDQLTGDSELGVKSFSYAGVELWSVEADPYLPAPAENENTYSVDFTMDEQGNVFVVGYYTGGGGGKSGDFGDEYSGVYVVAVDASGNVSWRNNIVSPEENQRVFPAKILHYEGQILVVCQTGGYEAHEEGVYSYRATNGEALWQNHRPSTDNFYELIARFANISSEGALYISGLGVGSGSNEQFIYLNKYSIEEIIPTSINDIQTANQLNLWPNPAKDLLYIKSDDVIQAIRITGMDGKLVYQSENIMSLNAPIDVSHFAPQLYTVSITTVRGIETGRFAKQ